MATAPDCKQLHRDLYGFMMRSVLSGAWPNASDRTHSDRYSALIRAVEAAKSRGDAAELRARFATLIDFVSGGRASLPDGSQPVLPPQALSEAQDEWSRNVAIVCAQMEQTPWSKHLTKARRLAETGAVEDMRDAWSTWLVRGDHGEYQMDAEELVCSCPYGTHKHEPCAHRTAVEIVKRCIAGGVQQPRIAREEQPMETAEETRTAPEETMILDEKEFLMPKTAAVDPAPVASQTPAPPANVYQAMARVAAKVLEAGGVAKTRTMQGSRPYRGIDDLMTALAPFLAAEGLLILPQTNSVDLTEAKSVQQAVVHMEFTAVHAPSGTMVSRLMVGEGQDPGDKAILKAQAYAFKQYLQYAFFIPVEGMEADNDRETIPAPPRRAVPDMTQAKPLSQVAYWEQRIRALLLDGGKSTPEAEAYFDVLRKKYTGDDYAKRLPGIYNGLRSKLAAADAPKAEAW